MKHKTKSLILAAITLFAIALATVLANFASGCSSDFSELIVGTWQVVYRYTDDEGNDNNYYAENEYLELTKNTFNYYKGTEKVFESGFKYKWGTTQENQELQKLSLIDCHNITLDKFGEEKEFGLRSYSTNCMLFCRYSYNTPYALLVRCPSVGETSKVEMPADATWKSPLSKNDIATIGVSGGSLSGDYFKSTTESNFIMFETNWIINDKLVVDKKIETTILYSNSDYFVGFNIIHNRYKETEEISTTRSVTVYLKDTANT